MGDLGLIPGLVRSPREGKGYPLLYSGLENSLDCIIQGVAKSQAQLSDFLFTLLTEVGLFASSQYFWVLSMLLSSIALNLWVLCSVARSCLTLCDPMDFTVHGILQARILEWVAVSFSRGSYQPRDQTQVSRIAGRFFTIWATREAQEYWSG